MELIIQKSGLYQYHKKEAGEKGKTRIENLEELVTSAKNFEQSFEKEKSHKEIAEIFLDTVSLMLEILKLMNFKMLCSS